jgi:hypothetical protein
MIVDRLRPEGSPGFGSHPASGGHDRDDPSALFPLATNISRLMSQKASQTMELSPLGRFDPYHPFFAEMLLALNGLAA